MQALRDRTATRARPVRYLRSSPHPARASTHGGARWHHGRGARLHPHPDPRHRAGEGVLRRDARPAPRRRLAPVGRGARGRRHARHLEPGDGRRPFEPTPNPVALRVPDVAEARDQLEKAGWSSRSDTIDSGVCLHGAVHRSRRQPADAAPPVRAAGVSTATGRARSRRHGLIPVERARVGACPRSVLERSTSRRGSAGPAASARSSGR